jgi:hypothetical protein
MRFAINPWSLILIGSVLTLVGGVMVTLGWSRVKQRDEAYSLSSPPSIDVSVRPPEDPKKQTEQDVIFENTGQHELKDVRTWSVLYNVDKDQITSRSAPGGGELISDKWSPTKQIKLSAKKITFWNVPPRTDEERSQMRCIALVTTYRRQADNRRFVDIELFIVENINGAQCLFPFLGSASSGPPQNLIKVFKEITDSEKFIFKSE